MTAPDFWKNVFTCASKQRKRTISEEISSNNIQRTILKNSIEKAIDVLVYCELIYLKAVNLSAANKLDEFYKYLGEEAGEYERMAFWLEVLEIIACRWDLPCVCVKHIVIAQYMFAKALARLPIPNLKLSSCIGLKKRGGNGAIGPCNTSIATNRTQS